MTQIYNSNNLRTGMVMYLTEDFTWSEDMKDALKIDENDENLIRECEHEGNKAVNANLIVEPYWVAIADDGLPKLMREKMRASGPTVDYKPSLK